MKTLLIALALSTALSSYGETNHKKEKSICTVEETIITYCAYNRVRRDLPADDPDCLQVNHYTSGYRVLKDGKLVKFYTSARDVDNALYVLVNEGVCIYLE